ncbi:PAS domain-containing protein [Sungkyunkwania multivorans]|uniref:PAS domain-containing protein n=1 Tax=Sungkyunkwania multivorans TaxID=1173618 RepID=A0ABW3D1X6_9FLAO
MKRNQRRIISPIQCWDIFSKYLTEIPFIKKRQQDIDQLDKLGDQYSWSVKFEELLDQDYLALVVTDASQRIQWVNPGFSKMTGYSSTYALGRTPHFLQGPQTSKLSKDNIRKNIMEERQFSERITNYRKNGDRYLCEVKIYPLKDHNDTTTHYIAVEKEVIAA